MIGNPDRPLQPAADAADQNAAADTVRAQVAAAHAAQDANRFPHWVVLGPETTDEPGAYLARLWYALPTPEPTGLLVRAATLDGIRALMPPGLVRLDREKADDANIVETWF